MKFATQLDRSAGRSLDGALLVVSRDLASAVPATSIAPDLLAAVQQWDDLAPALQTLYDDLNAGAVSGSFAFEPAHCAAPLPRSPQWLDGSAFLNHGRLMEEAFDTPPIVDFDTIPLMYQGASDDFLGACADVAMLDEADGIDFEGEFGVIVSSVPMGATPDVGLAAVRLIVQLNDWSLRALGAREVKSGFGFVHAKPSTAFAPVAVTPDELGDAWDHGRVRYDLRIDFNGAWFGSANGSEMAFGFGDLIAHAARSRRLTAGTIIGSGTVSNADRSVGSSCISERRVIEIIDTGAARTSFMHFGDRVRMEAMQTDGTAGPFGAIDQRIVAVAPGAR
jgi:fumarylacetoacetate (FAA) hydrolase